ncbi:MAG TPA: hypothetical protein DCZ97_03470 [Syntrophus sp. (in: bacteria)]|nr:hypothetical protein [Syntrophus sp. (in: bacteria)]
MLEKLGGLVTIVIAVTGLALISVFEPPTFVQIVCALAGSVVCLIGVVIAFAEGPIFTKDHRIKAASKVG